MWNFITSILNFTGIEDKTVWQDVFISALLIPIGILTINKILFWLGSKRPSRLLFNGYLNNKEDIFIFHSQMSGSDNNWNFNPSQKYITRYPDPTPTDHAHLGIQQKRNIDPVLSEAEMECVADVYNIFGIVGKTKNIVDGDLIRDWNAWSNPIISVGFNPKSLKLIEKCKPIYFHLDGGEISITNGEIKYNSILPNDAGVIQKTFTKDTLTPIFILAGLGTTGTSAAGHILKKHFVDFGKLYGKKSFCAFLKVKINEGKGSALLDKIYPAPGLKEKFFHPFVYHKFKSKNYFKYK